MGKLIAGSFVRSWASLAAGWFVAHGFVAADQQSMLVNAFAAALLYGGAQVWSLLHKAKKVAA